MVGACGVSRYRCAHQLLAAERHSSATVCPFRGAPDRGVELAGVCSVGLLNADVGEVGRQGT